MTMTKEKLDPPQSVVSFSEKNYRPSAVEQDLYGWWERSGFFTPDESNPNKPFVMMLPLPNVTGDLHLGHALGFGGYEDLMARWHRMLGEPTLYMPGTDHAGIIAQKVVEDELAKNEIGRNDLGREKFVAEMWKWMDHYRPRIEKQLRLLGCSLDWSRRNFTWDGWTGSISCNERIRFTHAPAAPFSWRWTSVVRAYHSARCLLSSGQLHSGVST